MARLGDHPHIVTVHDIGEESGEPFIVSQYMAGGPLERVLSDAPGRRLPIGDVVSIAIAMARALEHAHSKGVVHRDLKPANIWLTEDGTAMLGDFGLAFSLDRSTVDHSGQIVGTVAYMAPEQALGRKPDAAGDLYSLGARDVRDGVRAATVRGRRRRRRDLAARVRRAGGAVLARARAAAGARAADPRPAGQVSRRPPGRGRARCCAGSRRSPRTSTRRRRPATSASCVRRRTRWARSPRASSSAASARSSSSATPSTRRSPAAAGSRCSWASRASGRRAPRRSSPPTPRSVARACSWAAATRWRARPPTGRGCRRRAGTSRTASRARWRARWARARPTSRASCRSCAS